MTFNSIPFGLFFAVAFISYYFIGNSPRLKLWLLLTFNLVFYATWSPKFIPVMLAMGLLDYEFARRIFALNSSKKKAVARRLLIASVFVNVGIIFLFRCFSSNLHMLVPLGLTFFTFQSLSYVLDVYRGSYKPNETRLEFLTSLTFFPHLLAGPIVRSSFLIPQFNQKSRDLGADPEQMKEGAILVASGLIKKSLADFLSPMVEQVFSGSGVPDFMTAWSGALGFSAQVYCDIAGYSDLACGFAILLGFRLPINMNLPYLSTSVQEFWNRWYISVSSWFRDYVFYPLAMGWLKNRLSLNILVTMIIVGLWHGFTANYVLFGIYHGVLMIVAQVASRKKLFGNISDVSKIAITYLCVLFGQLIFRSPNFERFSEMSLGLVNGFSILGGGGNFLITASAVLVFSHVLDYSVRERISFLKQPIPYWSFTTVALLLAMLVRARPTFIYFDY